MIIRITAFLLILVATATAEDVVHAAVEPELFGLRLQVVAEPVSIGKEAGANSRVTLSVRSWVKNVGKKRMMVPSSSYDGQPSCWSTGGGEYGICFIVGRRVVEGEALTPSPLRFFPVMLEPGEATELPEYKAEVSARDEVKKVSVEFIVDRGYGKRQGWWFGELRREVEVKKPNQTPEPMPHARHGSP